MILLGLVFVVVGTVMLAFNRQIYNFTGGLDFIENHFTAGTPAFLKLVAVILVLVGIMMVTGVARWLTGPLGRGLNNLLPPKK